MTITLYVQPGAKKTELAGAYNGHKKLKVQAPPIDGAANEKAVSFIAQTFGAPKSAVALIRGEKSRIKTFSVDETTVKNSDALALFS
jgi:uncharacterized protein (TIGR00251 family)